MTDIKYNPLLQKLLQSHEYYFDTYDGVISKDDYNSGTLTFKDLADYTLELEDYNTLILLLDRMEQGTLELIKNIYK